MQTSEQLRFVDAVRFIADDDKLQPYAYNVLYRRKLNDYNAEAEFVSPRVVYYTPCQVLF